MSLGVFTLDRFPTGLIAVTGGEGTGKTRLLRVLSGDLAAGPGEAVLPDARWLDLDLMAHREQMPHQVWAELREGCPRWNAELQHDLVEAMNLNPHLEKKLYMLSTGSRRKIALVGLLACGATVTCLDQPYAALDAASIKVLREFLSDMSDHATRSWVIADYQTDPHLSWRRVISLDQSVLSES
ncbi:MAG: ATP-binding cassette domain-containing protein [Rhodoferax sp.]|uniref:ABC transporter ATP-binding protein n=1 Tax=Rhodoferax sp. TaxID=50421 RepID=UPI001B423F86|nr:ATP-binding cassette domain-containing protein [Rhodoferax sp.]MBP9904157.1 ATP-binding cassette domain-containing protein [Rhodoferax sp.]